MPCSNRAAHRPLLLPNPLGTVASHAPGRPSTCSLHMPDGVAHAVATSNNHSLQPTPLALRTQRDVHLFPLTTTTVMALLQYYSVATTVLVLACSRLGVLLPPPAALGLGGGGDLIDHVRAADEGGTWPPTAARGQVWSGAHRALVRGLRLFVPGGAAWLAGEGGSVFRTVSDRHAHFLLCTQASRRVSCRLTFLSTRCYLKRPMLRRHSALLTCGAEAAPVPRSWCCTDAVDKQSNAVCGCQPAFDTRPSALFTLMSTLNTPNIRLPARQRTCCSVCWAPRSLRLRSHTQSPTWSVGSGVCSRWHTRTRPTLSCVRYFTLPTNLLPTPIIFQSSTLRSNPLPRSVGRDGAHYARRHEETEGASAEGRHSGRARRRRGRPRHSTTRVFDGGGDRWGLLSGGGSRWSGRTPISA